MPIITFPLQPLLDIEEKTKDLPKKPTSDDLFDSDCLENGTPLDKNGQSEKGVDQGMFWPDASRIDPSKLIDSFSLMDLADHGGTASQFAIATRGRI